MERGNRIKDRRRALSSHIVKQMTVAGNPQTYCGKIMFYATYANKGLKLCRRCQNAMSKEA